MKKNRKQFKVNDRVDFLFNGASFDTGVVLEVNKHKHNPYLHSYRIKWNSGSTLSYTCTYLKKSSIQGF